MSDPVRIGNAELWLGDCREIDLSSFGVDAVISDPPYGINYRSNHNSSRRGKWAKWSRHENFSGIIGDDRPIDPKPILDLDVPTVLWGGNYIADQLPPSRCWLIWDKRHGIGPNNQADAEMAWTNLDMPTRIHRQLWSGLLRGGEENVAKQDKVHPHQKPVDLMAFCFSHIKPKPRTVLDPFMGSASMGIACARLGIRFIGIEMDPAYFDIACERIRDAHNDLFVGTASAQSIQEELAI